MTSAVAFVPARWGSERVPGKNIRVLAGHPLGQSNDLIVHHQLGVAGGHK